MNSVLFSLVKRNLKIYLRDKTAVFFSFLSVIIILALYIFFLGKMQVDNITSQVGDIDGLPWLVNSWIMAGILMVSTVTVPLSAVGKLIDDRTENILDDFYVSPISKNKLALSYLISAWVIGFIMVMVNFIVGQIYIVSQGGHILELFTIIKIVGLLFFSIMTFSSFFFFIAIFIKTANAFGILSTIIGTFIGFLGGIYVPIGVLGRSVRNVMSALPTAHAVTLLRRVYMDSAIEEVFSGAPASTYKEYADFNGLNVFIGSFELNNWHMLLSMVIFMGIFYLLSLVTLSKNKL